jgi:hypothetical protein
VKFLQDFIPLEDVDNFREISTNLNLGYETEWIPKHLPQSYWLENIPLAFWLIKILKPMVLVELGTFHGASYMAFCQAIKHFNLPTRSYAIDLWSYSDVKDQFFGDNIFSELKRYNEQHYSTFSTLIRSTFDDAAKQFNNCEIDFLHIDGTHTYEAVKNDYITWKDKISNTGLILFHDINVYDKANNYGVYKFWNEIRNDYPSFSFTVNSGLGIIGVGQNLPAPIKFLFSADEKTTFKIQTIFGMRGKNIVYNFENLYLDLLITNSLSWKITAPLRKISKKFYSLNFYRTFRKWLS